MEINGAFQIVTAGGTAAKAGNVYHIEIKKYPPLLVVMWSSITIVQGCRQ